MPINNQSLNKELYKLLKVRGFDPIPKDSTGETSPVPDEADVFKFTFKQDGNSLGTAWATIDGNNKLTVYYGDDITKNVSENEDPNNTFDLSWTGFLKHLKMWAQRRQMGFDLENKDHLHSDMAQRDHAKKQEVAESNIKLMKKGITMPNISEGYYPMGKSASYNDNIPTVKIILQHTRQIQEGEQRYRNIARIFLENTQGERFLAPTNKPGIAQIYARHLAEGGNVNDERWNHIKSLCEEYGKMSGFVRAVRGNQFNESAQRLVEAGLNHYQSLRESLSKMRGHRGYNSYFENWTPTLMENEGDETTINELFVQETLDPRIESVMPILSKLSKTVSEMKEVKELDEWADSLIESPDDEVNAHNESSDEKNMKRKELEEVTDAEKADIKIKVPAYRRDKVTTSDLEKAKQKNISGPEGLKALNTKVDSNVKEGLGPEQKRVGQLGPTEKVKKNSGARGKLVGANESVEQGVTGGSGQNLSIQQLATISDEALDKAYGYGRSTPGNTFGWQANLMSAAYAKKMIDAGVTDIEKISDAIHKGWNVTAQKFVQNPDQFGDTEKLRQAGKLDAKLQQRAKLMKINYAQLDNEEQEKDRVVARALLQAIKGQQGVAEGILEETFLPEDILDEAAPWVDKLGLGNWFRKIKDKDATNQKGIRILSGVNHAAQLYFKTILALNASVSPALSLFWPLLGKQALLFVGGAVIYTVGKILATKIGRALFGSTEEALAFAKAHLKAGEEKKTSFIFDGKTYPVTVIDYDTISNLKNQIFELENLISSRKSRADYADYLKTQKEQEKTKQLTSQQGVAEGQEDLDALKKLMGK